MKYKLIKEYPGSPELGTVVEKISNSISSYHYKSGEKIYCVFNNHVEENPEYWEKVSKDIWWVVWKRDYIQEGAELFKAWTPYKIECIPVVWSSERQYFKTKEQAEEFLLYNKPCLSYSDIIWNFEERPKKDDVLVKIDKLIQVVKSKL